MIDKQKEFAETMRNIMRNNKDKHDIKNMGCAVADFDEGSRSLQEVLEAKFDELFGVIDNEENG